jgi:uncharacterized protein YqeY
MSELRTELNDAIKTAMKAKEPRAVSTLRLILAALKDRDIAERPKGNADGIGEDDILAMLQSMIKQRRDSITLYIKGGREELAQQEAEEIEIIERFLPAQMDEEAIAAAVTDILTETGATTLKDMGGVMGALRERYAGQMDFGKAGAIVKERLG